MQCDADGGDVAEAAHLGDETSAGDERVADAFEKGGLFFARYPVECSVGEYGVELGIEVERGGVALKDIEAEGAGLFEHGCGAVHTGDLCAGLRDALGEYAVAAAHVEDVFTLLRGEPFHYSAGEVGDESAVLGVGGCVPLLSGRHILPIVRGVFAHRNEDKQKE